MIPDKRKVSDYGMPEVLMSTLLMFLLKEGSRNAFNNSRKTGVFLDNILGKFGARLPHMDTVDAILRKLDPSELERLRTAMIRILLEKKVFHKFRLFNAHFLVAVDATGVMSVNEGHCEHCLHMTTNKGKHNQKTTYFHNVLEAKLICENGFSISLATEWIENPSDYDKQDCELKAFKRLAENLKTNFPRLPICIVVDSLYPNKPFFDICMENSWDFIVTLKDGCLPALQEEIDLGLAVNKNFRSEIRAKKKLDYEWLNQLDHDGTRIDWLRCIDGDNKFVFVTSLNCTYFNVFSLSNAGRLRSEIEDSFNTQKNRGYGLKHKYSRTSMKATKNYYLLMQIAHMLAQLYELSDLFKPRLVSKTTVTHLWKVLKASLYTILLDLVAPLLTKPRIQIRYQ